MSVLCRQKKYCLLSADVIIVIGFPRCERSLIKFSVRVDLGNELMGTRGEGWGAGIVREFGIDVYTLLYLKWITRASLVAQW